MTKRIKVRRLRYYRLKRQFTVPVLSELTGIPKHVFFNAEAYRRKINIKYLKPLCEALGVTEEQLIDFSPNEYVGEVLFVHEEDYITILNNERVMIDKITGLVVNAQNWPEIAQARGIE